MGYRDLYKHPEWFQAWQKKFYNSKRWQRIRDKVRDDNNMRCEWCQKLILGKSIVDHKTEINTNNYKDESVVLGRDNLQLLCLKCHNNKTHTTPMQFAPNAERKVNLF